MSIDGLQLTDKMRDKPSLAGGVVFALAIILLLLSFFHIYYMETSVDADLLWNANEVLFFAHGEHRGYHVSYLGYAAALAKRYFGVVDPPDDRKSFTTIIRITAKGTERREVKGIFEYCTPQNGLLYTAHDGDLWRWIGTDFQKATARERQQMDNIEPLSRKDFTDLNGWSGHYSVLSRIRDESPKQVSGLPLSLDLSDGKLLVDLSDKHIEERLYYSHAGMPQRVRKAVYDRVFATTSPEARPDAGR
jgi:hypothetical protein